MDHFSWIILTRNPATKRLIAVVDDDERIAEFHTEEAAMDAADNTTVCKAWGYELMEVGV